MFETSLSIDANKKEFLEYLYDKVTERDTEKAISSVREEVCALLVKKLSDPHILNSLAVLS